MNTGLTSFAFILIINIATAITFFKWVQISLFKLYSLKINYVSFQTPSISYWHWSAINYRCLEHRGELKISPLARAMWRSKSKHCVGMPTVRTCAILPSQQSFSNCWMSFTRILQLREEVTPTESEISRRHSVLVRNALFSANSDSWVIDGTGR